MRAHLTNQSRKVLALANDAALAFNHEYVGTEHVLLGLVEDSSNGVSDVLAMLGVSADNVRSEIENLVQRGTEPVSPRPLPLTSRVRRAIDHAGGEAAIVGQKCVGPEHLLLGLASDPEGLAGVILRNLGLSANDLRAEVLKIRIEQMKVVERVVRPLQASMPRKRRMREELLAHLSAIYDQEQARLHDTTAALAAAVERFGDPRQLSREMESSLPSYERASHYVERWFGWRAPESASRFALRQATLTFGLLAVILPLLVAGVYLRLGWVDGVQSLARTLSAILFITPPAHFLVMFASIKMRDAFWGVFGSQKSLARVAIYAVLIGIVITASLLGATWAAELDAAKVEAALPFCALVGVIGATATVLLNRFLGKVTIRDTHWALLSL